MNTPLHSIAATGLARAALVLTVVFASLRAPAVTVNAIYGSLSDVPVTASGYTASGNTVNFTLNCALPTGTDLVVVKNTGGSFINGKFNNLAQGQAVSLTYGGTTYGFVANYYGGPQGRDLVLVWAGKHAVAWGYNYNSQLGAFSSGNTPAPVITNGVLVGKTVVAVAVGFGHSLALCSDGTLAAWGDNTYGQLGDNSTTQRFLPVAVNTQNYVSALAGKTVVAISAGVHHSMALCSDGSVAAWGDNTYGQIGDNTTTQRNAPTAVQGAFTRTALTGKSVVGIAAGAYHSLALCSDGSVAAWGNNNNGQLGQLNPVTVTVQDITIIVSVFGGSTYTIGGQTCGLGFSVPGTLTTYTETAQRQVPGLVRTSQDISALFGRTVTNIRAGATHSMALCSDGNVAVWGDNTSGNLGDGTTDQRDFPVTVNTANGSALNGKSVVGIGGGIHHNTAVTSDGAAVAWGLNDDHEIGDDTTTPRLLPVAVSAASLGTGERFTSLSGGSETYHNLAIVAPPVLPSAEVSGNGVVIANGSVAPDGGNYTDFGPSLVGGSVVKTFVIKNNGPGALSLVGTPKITVSGVNAADFTVTQQPNSPVNGKGGTTTFQVTFSPTGNYLRTATVNIANNDPANSQFTFAIQGTGPAPDVRVLGNGVTITNGSATPSQTDFTDFGITALNTPVVRTFTVKNNGTGVLTLTGTPLVSLSGANAADFRVTQAPSSTLAGGGAATTTFQVTFTPAVTGLRKATVSIASDDRSNTNYTFSIQGSGPAPVMSLSGNGVAIPNGSAAPNVTNMTDFGSIKLNTSPVVQTFTISNTGTAALSLSGTPKVAISGSSDFTVTQPTVSSVASGTGSATFQITFNPVIAGLRAATVTIANNDTRSSPYTFAVQGRGVAPAPVAGLPFIWGGGLFGGLGNNDSKQRNVYSPVSVDTSGVLKGKTFSAIASGNWFGVALSSDGKLFSWGYGDFSQLGDNKSSPSSSLVPVAVYMDGALAGKTVTAISCWQYGTVALTTEGKVYAWGRGGESGGPGGSLGDGTTSSRNAPVLLQGALAGKNIVSVAAGFGGGFALDDKGKVYAWGRNSQGELGSGASIYSPALSPVAITTLANETVTALDAGFVLTAKNELYTWGPDGNGELGNGTVLSPYYPNLGYQNNGGSPTPVKVDMTGVLKGKTIVAIASGSFHRLVLDKDGQIYAWGGGGAGELGNGTSADSSLPVKVTMDGALAGKKVVAISAGYGTSQALTSDGMVYCWGAGYEGEVGNGNNNAVTLPTAVDMSGVLKGATVVKLGAGAGSFVTIPVIATLPGPPPPIAANDSYTVNEDTMLVVTNAQGVLVNDTGTGIGASLVTPTQNGTLVLYTNGSFTYLPATNFYGTDSFTYTATNNAGTSAVATVTIKVNPVNDAPSVTLATSTIAVVQGSGAYVSGAGFATFSPGPANESLQTLLGYTLSADNRGLFSVQPAIDKSGALTFTPDPATFGSATITVVVQDSGGTANGGSDKATNSFTITVNPTNSAPSVIFPTPKVTVLKNSVTQTLTGFATFSPGPATDSAQTLLGYLVGANNSSLFSIQPTINNSGTLSFKPATGATGSTTVTVVVQDNGGTAGGGVDKGTNSFIIEIKAVDPAFEVTTTADSGPGSLRQALLNANAAMPPVTILVDNGLGQFNPTPPLPTITNQVIFDPGAGNTFNATLPVGTNGSLSLDGTTLAW